MKISSSVTFYWPTASRMILLAIASLLTVAPPWVSCARFGDPLGSPRTPGIPDKREKEPYYSKEHLKKSTADDLPFGIGGLVSMGGAAWEGVTRVGKGVLGMGDVTDENESLGVQSYSSLHDYDIDPPSRYRQPSRRYRRRQRRRHLQQYYGSSYDPYGTPYKSPKTRPYDDSSFGVSFGSPFGSPFKHNSFGSPYQRSFKSTRYDTHDDVPGAQMAMGYRNLPHSDRAPGYNYDRRRRRYRSYQDDDYD